MTTPNRSTRFMLTDREAALRLGQVTALVAISLPAGFHVLPRAEQKQLVQDRLAEALTVAETVIDNDCQPLVPARAAEVTTRDFSRPQARAWQTEHGRIDPPPGAGVPRARARVHVEG